jgi:hypothetical protein
MVHMNGPRIWPFGSPSWNAIRHISTPFCSIFEGRNTHISSVVFDSYQQMNAFGPYTLWIYPSNEWCWLLYSAQLWLKKHNIHVTPNFGFHNSYVLFARMASMGTKKTMCDRHGLQRGKKKGQKNEISTTCWLFKNARWPMGVEKCMVWGWPSLVVLSGLLVARTKRMKLMQCFFIKNVGKCNSLVIN